MDGKESTFNRVLLIILVFLFVGTLAAFAYPEIATNSDKAPWWMFLLNLLILAIPCCLIYASIYILVLGFRDHSTRGTVNLRLAKFIHWAPRIASILIIFFISLFSLDVFSMDGNFWQLIGGFLVHNIPSITLLALLIFAWNRPVVGFVAFLAAAALGAIFILRSFLVTNLLMFVLPILLIAALFYADWQWLKPKNAVDADAIPS